MIIKLTGLGELDGEYELDPQPNLKELTAFRKTAGLSPSELTDAVVGGGLEVLPLYIFTVLNRLGRSDLALQVLEVPFDQWSGADVLETEDPEDAQLPPVRALDGHVSESATA